MLTVTVPAAELFDEKREMFINTAETVLTLEHSLVSVSKWEAKTHKPFLSEGTKTVSDILDYMRCMTLNDVADDNVYYAVTGSIIDRVRKYIDDPATATWFTDEESKPGSSEVVTSELVYYWMTALKIPFKPCEDWHFNRLMTLIRICGIKNDPKPKQMSMAEIMRRNARLNEERKKAWGTTG